MSTSYRVLEFDRKTNEFCVVFTNNNVESRIFVPAVLSSDKTTVLAEKSKAAISKAIETVVSQASAPTVTGFESLIGETYETTAYDPAQTTSGVPTDPDEL